MSDVQEITHLAARLLRTRSTEIERLAYAITEGLPKRMDGINVLLALGLVEGAILAKIAQMGYDRCIPRLAELVATVSLMVAEGEE